MLTNCWQARNGTRICKCNNMDQILKPNLDPSTSRVYMVQRLWIFARGKTDNTKVYCHLFGLNLKV